MENKYKTLIKEWKNHQTLDNHLKLMDIQNDFSTLPAELTIDVLSEFFEGCNEEFQEEWENDEQISYEQFDDYYSKVSDFASNRFQYILDSLIIEGKDWDASTYEKWSNLFLKIFPNGNKSYFELIDFSDFSFEQIFDVAFINEDETLIQTLVDYFDNGEGDLNGRLDLIPRLLPYMDCVDDDPDVFSGTEYEWVYEDMVSQYLGTEMEYKLDFLLKSEDLRDLVGELDSDGLSWLLPELIERLNNSDLYDAESFIDQIDSVVPEGCILDSYDNKFQPIVEDLLDMLNPDKNEYNKERAEIACQVLLDRIDLNDADKITEGKATNAILKHIVLNNPLTTQISLENIDQTPFASFPNLIFLKKEIINGNNYAENVAETLLTDASFNQFMKLSLSELQESKNFNCNTDEQDDEEQEEHKGREKKKYSRNKKKSTYRPKGIKKYFYGLYKATHGKKTKRK